MRNLTKSKLKQKNIGIVTKGLVSRITDQGVELSDGRFIKCDVPVWATGA
jgi:NADH dehydrogenase FAD-containing subunit